MNDELSKQVIGAAFQVHNELGFGCLESVYENALSVELKKRNVELEQQKKVKVFYFYI